jgi:hypothetical protein
LDREEFNTMQICVKVRYLDKLEIDLGGHNLGNRRSFQFGQRHAAGTDASGGGELGCGDFWRRQAGVQQLAPETEVNYVYIYKGEDGRELR